MILITLTAALWSQKGNPEKDYPIYINPDQIIAMHQVKRQILKEPFTSLEQTDRELTALVFQGYTYDVVETPAHINGLIDQALYDREVYLQGARETADYMRKNS